MSTEPKRVDVLEGARFVLEEMKDQKALDRRCLATIREHQDHDAEDFQMQVMAARRAALEAVQKHVDELSSIGRTP